MTSCSASVSLEVLRQEGIGATTSEMLAGTGRKSAFMLRTMCIILDTLGTAVFAEPISPTHTGMMCVVSKYLVYIPEINQ